jgi:hypothetical protein
MFTYPTLLISYVYTILLPSTAFCLCRTAIAHPYIYMYLLLFIPLHLCVQVFVVKLINYLLDITALSELEAQAFRCTHINIC